MNMTAKVAYSTPMLHVAEIENSIRFYEMLGFTTVDTDRTEPLGWARVHCAGGAIMFLKAEEQVNASAQGVMLTMYSSELKALRDQMVAGGVKVSPISYPEYMPSGEMRMADPDGYAVTVCQWGEQEQKAWEKRIGKS